MELAPGVTAHEQDTDRLRIHYLSSGPADGIPVVLVHGNLSTGRFYETVMAGAPSEYRFIAPDMRGFGRSERKALDATRGLADWADDVHALVQALGIQTPVHLAGWSTGGAAVTRYAMDRPVASITLIDPVSPYGFGGCHRDGTPCFPDWAGTGGGTGNPEFVQRLLAGDRGSESPFSPRNVMASSYWSPSYTMPEEQFDVLVDEVLLSTVGDDGYPGDATASENWPGMAPGTLGILNALSGKYCDWSGIVDIDPKSPILWTHGTEDIVIADGSAWEMGTLGAAGYVPGWPGAEVYPPQPQVTQIRDVLEEYGRRGGRVQIEMMEGSGHGPVLDAADRWNALFYAFLDTAR
ncbi:MAG: alpha/beta fold hydrolase [Actinomycetales bacterium]